MLFGIKFETLQTFSQYVLLFGGIMTALSAFGSWWFGKEITPTQASKKDVEEIFEKKLENFYQRLKPPDIEITQKYPGFSMHMVVLFKEITEKRRKYIFDLGNTKKERVSMYFAPSNEFTLAFIDSQGDPHALRVPSGPEGVPLKELIYFSCEIGVTENSTKLRVLVNGQQVGGLDLPFKANPSDLDPKGAVLGANLKGELGASFDITEIVLYSTTVTTEETQKLLNYFKSKPIKGILKFKTQHWMRVTGREEELNQKIQDSPRE